MRIVMLETNLMVESGEKNARITTSNKRLLKELNLLAQREPKMVKLKGEDEDLGAKLYTFPKSWIKIVPPTK